MPQIFVLLLFFRTKCPLKKRTQEESIDRPRPKNKPNYYELRVPGTRIYLVYGTTAGTFSSFSKNFVAFPKKKNVSPLRTPTKNRRRLTTANISHYSRSRVKHRQQNSGHAVPYRPPLSPRLPPPPPLKHCEIVTQFGTHACRPKPREKTFRHSTTFNRGTKRKKRKKSFSAHVIDLARREEHPIQHTLSYVAART